MRTAIQKPRLSTVSTTILSHASIFPISNERGDGYTATRHLVCPRGVHCMLELVRTKMHGAYYRAGLVFILSGFGNCLPCIPFPVFGGDGCSSVLVGGRYRG